MLESNIGNVRSYYDNKSSMFITYLQQWASVQWTCRPIEAMTTWCEREKKGTPYFGWACCWSKNWTTLVTSVTNNNKELSTHTSNHTHRLYVECNPHLAYKSAVATSLWWYDMGSIYSIPWLPPTYAPIRKGHVIQDLPCTRMHLWNKYNVLRKYTILPCYHSQEPLVFWFIKLHNI